MEQRVTDTIEHMAKSHGEMAKILDAKRHIAVRMSQIIVAIPDVGMTFGSVLDVTASAMDVSKNIAAYLNSFAELQDGIAENLSIVMKELKGTEEE
ncbi:nucleoside-diphosphate sugar epimerase [Paenibacillus sp. y28]|uniref:nucleoside-diphosphate sugar epimerase n=1 Tax=Paenibacillus sp. y28 TaxID=3129110 RepID=UPI00301665AA